MGVNINESWRNDHASCIDFSFRLTLNSSNRGDFPILNRNISKKCRISRAIHNSSMPNDQFVIRFGSRRKTKREQEQKAELLHVKRKSMMNLDQCRNDAPKVSVGFKHP